MPGARRNPAAEQRFHEQAPLHDFFVLHRDALVALGPVASMVVPGLTLAPRLAAATRKLDPVQLTEQLKDYAAELGIIASGVTAFDPKYTFAEHTGKAVGEHVVVCVLEQNYDATQRIPALKSEQVALATYGELEDRMVALAQWLRDRGWHARPENFMDESMFIAYAVAAGLGQLGLNGQLLTPHAGSRCRITC